MSSVSTITRFPAQLLLFFFLYLELTDAELRVSSSTVSSLTVTFILVSNTLLRIYHFDERLKLFDVTSKFINSQISNVENLSPQIIRRVAKEMSELSTQPPEGIRVILNEDDVTDIQAVIEGPGELIDKKTYIFSMWIWINQ